MGPMLRTLVYNSSIGRLMLCRGQAPQLRVATIVTPFYGLLYLKRAALLCPDFIHLMKVEYLDSVLVKHFCFIWMSYARARQTGAQRLFYFQ